MNSDAADAARPKPILEIAETLAIPADALEPYGSTKAKIALDFIDSLADGPDGKLVLVSAMTPTPAGEGKTTTTIGLGDALARAGARAAICLREPSLGPCFGMKGGAAGGGRARLEPMADINLHFTGDIHAVAAAHNLLAAMLDNHIYWGNALRLDARRIAWRRVVDMNDRALRDMVVSLGGLANGFPRQTGYEAAVSSELMAILCLATGRNDLHRRLSQVVVGQSRERAEITADDLKATGAMAALLKDALLPNLVQTAEHTPAFVHGGPFGNIAHGCNSVMATRTALKLADHVVTEAGFGADLGAEKFFDIKCRKAGLAPDAVVLVATLRALKAQGGAPDDALDRENIAALKAGLSNLGRHIRNIGKFGLPVAVALNRRDGDGEREIAELRAYCEDFGVEAHVCTHWADGSAGAAGLADAVLKLTAGAKPKFRLLYDDDLGLWEKTRRIARRIYHADDIIADQRVRDRYRQIEEEGFARLPICMAKTQYSFSTDPNLKGAPDGHVVRIADVRLAAGAEYVVPVCGDIMTMPGLPRHPAAEHVDLDDDGRVTGLI